jgi:regulator of protease activity HflC (stomatin/prohibitin superfamily)
MVASRTEYLRTPAPAQLDGGGGINWLKFGLFGGIGFVALILFFSFVLNFTRIGVGHVGLEVKLSGTQRGVQDIPVRTGWVVYTPFNTQIVEFPTYVQTVQWTRDITEGHPLNEEMSFNSQDGMQFTGDVSLSYAIDPVKAADFYIKYRITDLEQFTHGVLKNIVRDELNRTATSYTAEQLYGDKKSEMLNITKAQIEKLMNPLGVGIQQFGFIHPPRPPEPLVQAINAKIQAVQQAEKARNELATTQAEAAKVVAEAEGTATAQVTRAKGEAEANKIRNSAITTQLLEMRRLDNQHDWIYRWNGEVPKVSAGQGTGLLLQLEPK